MAKNKVWKSSDNQEEPSREERIARREKAVRQKSSMEKYRNTNIDVVHIYRDVRKSHTIPPENDNTQEQLLFTQIVDWALLHNGIIIPKKIEKTFYRAIAIQHSDIKPHKNISILLSNKTFYTKYYWTYGELQIKWTPNDKIAIELRSIFSNSYELLKKQFEKSNRKRIHRCTNEITEYIDVVVNEQSGIIRLVPHSNHGSCITNPEIANDNVEKYSLKTNTQTSLANSETKKDINLIGKRVKIISEQKEGTITKQVLNFITITYDMDNSTRIFSYPKGFERNLEFVDDKPTVKDNENNEYIKSNTTSVLSNSTSQQISKSDDKNIESDNTTYDTCKNKRLVGQRVRHTISQKEGTIVEHEYNFMFVVYDSETEKHCFPYPSSIGKYLELLDNSKDKTPEPAFRKPVITYENTGAGIPSKIEYIITEKFKNGYRISKSIDYERFSNFYTEEYGEKPNIDARTLDRKLSNIAVLFDERAYIYDTETINTVYQYLNQTDAPCISIQSFYEQYSDKLLELRIYSSEMLKTFIDKYYDDIICKYSYIYLQSDISPTEMVRDVFSERETWSLDELYERFPNLNQDTIRQMMNRGEFIRVESGVYTHTRNLDLPYNEGQKIIDYVEKKLNTNDYILANELDLSQLLYLNPYCSYDAMRDIVFDKFLSGLFTKSGQIITRHGNKINTLDILEQYCREADTVSLEELSSLEASLDSKGRGHSACLAAANNIMVRVSNDMFVKESMVNFDIESIDEIISLYCPDDFIPLKSIKDFSLFPYAGYQWNLFLLESFVRRYSRLFKYDVRADNSSNVGVIVRKSFNYTDYNDILSVALANATLSLDDKDAILNYMYNKGFIARRNLGNSEDKIIGNAIKIREGAPA